MRHASRLPHCSFAAPRRLMRRRTRSAATRPCPRSRRHRHARPDAGARHSRRRHGDRPPDHRAARLHHADRGAVRRSRRARQPVRRARRQRQRVRSRHQLQPGAGAARRHADERRLRLLGGAFNFGVDTLADVERIEVIRGPMAALYGSGAIGGVINLISRQGHEPGLARHRRTRRRLSAADRGQRQRLRHRRAVRLLGHFARRSRSAATTPRRSACRSTPACRDGFRDADRHAQSRLHADRRHAAVAVPARAGARCSASTRSGNPDLRRQPTPPATTTRCSGRIGVDLEAVQRHL